MINTIKTIENSTFCIHKNETNFWFICTIERMTNNKYGHPRYRLHLTLREHFDYKLSQMITDMLTKTAIVTSYKDTLSIAMDTSETLFEYEMKKLS